MTKIALLLLLCVAAAIALPAAPLEGQEMTRIVREAAAVAAADPQGYGHHGHYHGGGGHGGYHGHRGHGGFHGHHGGHGYPIHNGHPGHGGHGGHGRYPQHAGGSGSFSNANAGSISTPFGSASFASANAGSHGYGR